MVKGEVDIVKDWVLYHGKIFGYNNLFIIDNYSFDGTWESLLKLREEYKINIIRLPNYKKKGEYMTFFLRAFGNGEIVFPIDIDEFIVYFNKKNNTISCDKNVIIQYIRSLPRNPLYKMNYINSKTLQSNGYKRAVIEMEYGKYVDYGSHAKTFFNSRLFTGVIDHGNHYSTNNYILSDLCLVHFHQRNLDQIKKKVYNNVKGLGHAPFNLTMLKNLQKNGTNTPGFHHVNKQISILENTFKLDINEREDTDISLKPLNEFINNLNS